MLQKWMKKILKFLASLKLAVVIILSLAFLIAIGTIVESKYDAIAAKKWVYDTVWMYSIMGALAVSLVAVMVDRWPWKTRHAPFVFAHIGIILLLLGSVMTLQFGIDGSLRVPVGQGNQFLVVPETDVLVYSSFDGDRYTKLEERPVDFFLHPPSPEKPVEISTYTGAIKFTGYKKYVIPKRMVTAAREPNGRRGAGLRFQIQNSNVNVVEWIVQRRAKDLATHDFGPAALHLGEAPAKGQGRNEIFFTPQVGKDSLKYVVFQKDQDRPLKSGEVKEGEMFVPGWKMPIEVRVLRYFPEAEEAWDLQERESPTPLTTSAARVEFDGKESWILLNDTLKLFTSEAVYIVTYGNRRLDLGFQVVLQNFIVDRYQGTMRAAAYKSHVSIADFGEHEISMNEPLKYKGFTIYQASFEDDPKTGQPLASVFSVNQDPGRWIKYLGSLIMSIGIILLFYFKQKAKKGNAT
ncbi:MAG: cytochrome c biogenesis protein ResB [Bdellovibrionaceae bacterium]|nr:cytochrome c biogenesis protein ResB [Pseudobdellovibrionaceae bacterium]